MSNAEIADVAKRITDTVTVVGVSDEAEYDVSRDADADPEIVSLAHRIFARLAGWDVEVAGLIIERIADGTEDVGATDVLENYVDTFNADRLRWLAQGDNIYHVDDALSDIGSFDDTMQLIAWGQIYAARQIADEVVERIGEWLEERDEDEEWEDAE